MREPSPCTSSGNSSPSRANASARRSRACASARSVVNSRNARPPLAFEHRQRGVDDRVGVLARIRLRQVARHVEQRLRRVVERAVPAAGRRVVEAELALCSSEKSRADGERRRREDPGARRLRRPGVPNTSATDSGDACSCQPVRRDVDPADPCRSRRRRASRGRRRRPARQRASCAPPSSRAPRDCARSSLRSAKWPSSVASRSSAAASSSSAAAKPSRSARASLRELAGHRRRRRGAACGSRARARRPRREGRARRARAVRAATSASRASSASCPAVDLLAEEERRGVGQLVRLVEDHRVARGQELGEALVAQHDVGEEQVVVDDDDVGLERVLARLQHEAVARGTRSSAPRQLSRVEVTSGQIDAFSGTSASSPRSPRCRRARERDDLRQMPRILARGQPAFARRALEMMVADVVRAALEQRERDRHRQRVAHQRQVALEELVLQRLGAGRDDDLAAVRAAPARDRRTSCRCRCRPRRPAGRARAIASATACAIASCCGRKRKPGSARARAPPSPKIAASSRSSAQLRGAGSAAERGAAQFALWSGRRFGGGAALALSAVPPCLGRRRPCRRRRPSCFCRPRASRGPRSARSPKIVIGLGDPSLVLLVALAGDST